MVTGDVSWMWPCGHDLVSGFVAHVQCQSPERYLGAGTGATASILGILGTRCCPDAFMAVMVGSSLVQALATCSLSWRMGKVPFVS